MSTSVTKDIEAAIKPDDPHFAKTRRIPSQSPAGSGCSMNSTPSAFSSGDSTPLPTCSEGSMVKKQNPAAAVRSTCSGSFR